MRIIIGIFNFCFIVAAYTFIPEITELLIKLNVLDDLQVYREPTWIYIYMVFFVTVGLVITYCFLILLFISIFGSLWKNEVKKAKRQSKEKYGVSFLYFVILDKKYPDVFVQEKSNYPYRLVEHYEKKYKIEGYSNTANKELYVKDHFERYRLILKWPTI